MGAKKVAIVLSGSGHRDGSEITEVVSAVLALSESRVSFSFFAPNENFETVDHLDGKSHGERNALHEAARIARGQVEPLEKLAASDFDAVVLPGGMGAAKVLSTWALKGASCTVLREVERILLEFHGLQKPIVAICIAPALVARVLGGKGISVTIGRDRETAKEIEKTGATHINCSVDDFVTDRENRIVTTPAYMFDSTPAQVFTGIRGAIREMIEMA